jgi:hypothetical protein
MSVIGFSFICMLSRLDVPLSGQENLPKTFIAFQLMFRR